MLFKYNLIIENKPSIAAIPNVSVFIFAEYYENSISHRGAQVEHARQQTAGSNEIPVISWQQYSNEWIQ